MTSPVSNRESNARRKATLFCAACDYHGVLPDDWIEHRTADERSLVCPHCGATVDRRTGRPPRVPVGVG